MTKLYHSVFTGKVLSPDSLRQMMDFKPFTAGGFAVGTPYGLGLMANPIRVPLATTSRSACEGFEHVCKCHAIFGCFFEATYVGHAGLDYGSGFPTIGILTELNVSVAIGYNTGESPMGMNFTLGRLENRGLTQAIQCPFFDTVVHHALPGLPAFRCQY